MIVDDNEQNLYMLRVLMEGHGYVVDTAVNGVKALETARRDPPDMIVSDVLMPVMDGFTLCREWKQDKQLKKTPFVFYTATYTDPKDEKFALRLGAERFITKPVEPEVLVELLEQVIANHEAGRLIAPREPSAEEPEVFREYSERLINKLEDKMLQLEQSNRRLRALYQASIGLVSIKPLGELVLHALNTVVEELGYTNASFFAYDDDEQRFCLLEAVGFSDELLETFRRELVFNLGEEQGLVGMVGQTREALIIADVIEEPRWIALDETIRSALFVPVVHEERLLGVVNFLSTEVGAFGDEDARGVLTLANNMATAIENTRLLEKVMSQNMQLSKLNRAIEQAAESVVITDARGNIEYVNPAFERITGYSRDEAIGQNPRILQSGKQDEAFYRDLWQTILDGKVWHGSLINRKKSGDLYHEEMTIAPILDESGNIANFVAMTHDITERVQAEQANQQYIRRLDALRKIDQAITGSLDLNVILNVLLGHLLTQLEVDAAAVLRYEKAPQSLTYFQGQGFHTTALQHTNLRLGQGHAGEAALQRRPVFIPDLNQPETSFSESREFKEEGFVAYYSIPLIAKGALVGVLEVFHRSALDPEDEWVDYLQVLAGQAAIAIDNITLFDDLQHSNTRLMQAYDATIEGWAQALEMRDMETEGHSRRVVEITMDLAQKLGISEEELAHIRRGALLHDIGKMGVPDAILQKPEKLSDEEWQIMYQHPVYAHEWLSSIEYLRPALDIPYCHHEKWDGTGYPRGLKGVQIPLAARIFAVVDVCDALRSNRPYRDAWPEEKIRKYIQEQSGVHFDPRVVEAFLNMIHKP